MSREKLAEYGLFAGAVYETNNSAGNVP